MKNSKRLRAPGGAFLPALGLALSLVLPGCGGGSGGGGGGIGAFLPWTADSGPGTASGNGDAAAPAITRQPASLAILAGQTAIFEAGASGAPAPSLRWQIEQGQDLADGPGSGALAGATITGAGTPVLTLRDVPASASGLAFLLRASNAAGTASSSAARLTVTEGAGMSIAAAAGGTVESPDGSLRVSFPPDAFTADVTVHMVPVAAPTLPSGPDFAPVRPLGASFFQLRYSGGQLKAGVPIALAVRSSAAAPLQKNSALQKDGGTAGVGIVQCGDGSTTAIYLGDKDGYGASGGFVCGPSNDGCIVGAGEPVDIRPTVAPFTVATDSPGNEDIVRIVNGSNGRSGFYYLRYRGDGSQEGRFGLVDGAARIDDSPWDGTSAILALDDGGLSLQVNADCSVSQAGRRIGGALGNGSQPHWTSAPLLAAGRSCAGGTPVALATDYSAAWSGAGWVVHSMASKSFFWLSSAGTVQREVPYDYSAPDSSQQDWPQLTHDLVADNQGNAWAAVSTRDGNPIACGGYPDSSGSPTRCPSLIHVGAADTRGSQRQLVNFRSSDQRADMSLAMDAGGAVYASAQLKQATNGSRLTVSRYEADGSPGWSTMIPEAFGLKPAGLVASGGKVHALGIGSLVNAAGDSYAWGGFVYRFDASGGIEAGGQYGALPAILYDDQSRRLRNARLFSVDADSALTSFGLFRGELDGVDSGSENPGSGGPGNGGSAVYLRKFRMQP